ncbi:MAG: protein kinase [Mycobacteriaceae bacterium]|jgi:serine/threonine protein kinase/ABC-type Fe3+-hydroxamate transport system substrate-binding protein|nr:protein kinase [Mycobacteriaceae bacterium]
MALSAGTVVAGYTIEAVLGAGGMGTVYRAAHPNLPRSDALKILSEEFSRDEEIRSRFHREADLAATLSHPGIVTVYNRGETDDGRLWIAMQYVPGTDADQQLRDGHMTPLRAVRIIGDVATALDYAHRRLILHRDVKPANFLLDADDDRVFLADFGIARALDDAVGLTRTGTVMASISYTAPESFKALPVDHHADIYSLGCALYQLLTGQTPFFQAQAGGMAAVVSAHLFEAPPKVTDLAPALPAAIDAVVAKAMAKDPAERYHSARELAADAAAAIIAPAAAPSRTQPWRTADTPPTGAAAPPGASIDGPRASSTPTQRPDPVVRPPEPELAPPSPFESPYPNPPPPRASASPPTPAPPSPYESAPAPPRRLVGTPVVPLRRPRRRRWVIASAVTLVVVLVAAAGGYFLLRDPGRSPYTPQTFVHAHGQTEVTAAPTAVAALGPGDADAVLSLGVQPVAVTAAAAILPGFERSAATANPAVLGSIDTAAIAKANPDLIIATGDIDDATFRRLTEIAPTITRPEDKTSGTWDWQSQLTWIGRILGESDKARELIDATVSRQNDVANQNPAFKGKSIEVLAATDVGIARVLSPSFASDYLQSLGFRYNQDADRNPVDVGATRPIQDLNDLYTLEPDYLVVIRTDAAAGKGGLSGLPRQLSVFSGRIMAVDDPDTIAAFADPGGYLAVKHLDDHFVAALAAA